MNDVLNFMKTDSRAIMPHRAHERDAGLDLYALESMQVKPGKVLKVETGIHVALDSNEVGLYWDKSGRASNGLTILGGCIDGPYRGPLSVVVANVNLSNTLESIRAMRGETNKFVLEKILEAAARDIVNIPYGKAVTQFLVVTGIRFPTPHEWPEEEWRTRFADTERGEKGFGSSDNNLSACKLHGGPHNGLTVPAVPKERIYHQGAVYARRGASFDFDHVDSSFSPGRISEILSPLSETGEGFTGHKA